MKKNRGAEIRFLVQSIRARYQHGEITLDQAKAEVQPLLDEMNASGKRIAKEFGKKFKPLTFGYIFR